MHSQIKPFLYPLYMKILKKIINKIELKVKKFWKHESKVLINTQIAQSAL